MQMRQLGRSPLRIAPLMFGGNVFGWTVDQATSFALLDAFVDAGFNAIDTADIYSRWVPGHPGGESETVIGDWLTVRGSSVRQKVVIATKLGMDLGEGPSGLSKAWIAEAVEASLKRLRIDYIDLYQAHKDDHATPLEETLEGFAKLIAAGKVRVIGASNYTAPRFAEALDVSARHGLPRYETLQPLYNLVERPAYEDALKAVCEAEGVGVIPYYSLASGFLTGKYRSEADLSKSTRGEGVKQYLNAHGQATLKALDEIAAQHNATPAQVALAWLMAQPTIVAPIASASSVEQLHDILQAASLSLSAADLASLDAASSGH